MFATMIRQKKIQHRILLGLLLVCAFWGFFSLLHFGNAQIPTLTNPVRLHIIANSDKPFDQMLKLNVRDQVVAYLTPLLETAKDREEAAKIVEENIPALEALATAATSSVGYDAKGYFGNFEFPDRQYGELFFPAGNYDALRLVLGDGAGQNWWCVLFPPLCFMDGASRSTLTTVPALSSKPHTAPGIKIKFRLAGSLDDAK